MELSSKVDYGSFPNLESTLQPPLHEILAPGPGVSVRPIPSHKEAQLMKFRTPARTSPSSRSASSPS